MEEITEEIAQDIDKILSDIQKKHEYEEYEKYEEVPQYQEEIDSLSKNNSKMRLAGAFRKMITQSARGLNYWRRWFIVSLLCLFIIGSSGFYFAFLKHMSNFNAGIFHFVLAVPAVWFAWFSAKQYSNLFKIVQDYAFKESIAMAFIGYRNEVASDEKMLNLLRKTAIENFSSNPVRLIIKYDEPVSPVHEVTQTLLKKINLDSLLKISKIVKNITYRKNLE